MLRAAAPCALRCRSAEHARASARAVARARSAARARVAHSSILRRACGVCRSMPARVAALARDAFACCAACEPARS
eukprot:1876357-Lingulodinium_polyedra.AAC.1